MFQGNLSEKEQREIKKWAYNKQNKLKKMWETQEITKLN